MDSTDTELIDLLRWENQHDAADLLYQSLSKLISLEDEIEKEQTIIKTLRDNAIKKLTKMYRLREKFNATIR